VSSHSEPRQRQLRWQTEVLCSGASIWTVTSYEPARCAPLNAGSCSINDVIRNIANPHALLGNGASGYGRYHGASGLYAFSRIRTVMENRTSRNREVNWFPLTRKKYQRLDTLIGLRHRPDGLIAALRRAFHLTAVTAIVASVLSAQGQAAHLYFECNFRERAWRIAYLVFNSPSGFPRNKTKAVICGFSSPVGREGTETIDVGEVAPGRYAVSLYLDENDNGRLDSGLFGIPRSPSAFRISRSRLDLRFEDGAFSMEQDSDDLYHFGTPWMNRPSSVAIIGAGLGGMSAAIMLAKPECA